MTPYTFVIKTDNPTKAILIAKEEITARNGYMNASSFRQGKYSGRYRQVPGGVEITIEDKPMLMPVTFIENKIKDYFAGLST